MYLHAFFIYILFLSFSFTEIEKERERDRERGGYWRYTIANARLEENGEDCSVDVDGNGGCRRRPWRRSHVRRQIFIN